MTGTANQQMWREHGRRIGAYDAPGKTLPQLAEDYALTHAEYSTTLESYRTTADTAQAAAQDHAETLHARLCLIEEAIEEAGGWIDPWCDDTGCKVYGPDRNVLATF